MALEPADDVKPLTEETDEELVARWIKRGMTKQEAQRVLEIKNGAFAGQVIMIASEEELRDFLAPGGWKRYRRRDQPTVAET